MNQGNEILQALSKKVNDRIAEKESQRKWYETMAVKFLGSPVQVNFL